MMYQMTYKLDPAKYKMYAATTKATPAYEWKYGERKGQKEINGQKVYFLAVTVSDGETITNKSTVVFPSSYAAEELTFRLGERLRFTDLEVTVELEISNFVDFQDAYARATYSASGIRLSLQRFKKLSAGDR